jgi:hypothetical protein
MSEELKMLVTVLQYVKNEQLPFVMFDFKPCKRCNDRRKLLIEQNSLVAARVMFLNAVHMTC